ncbi:DUF3885 domain-containing protein [Paenibacillus polysaccharolyticus]|uniref:DUF3885 domain-containing protein n=1 Tax=Paenibacillus polysaccharolyticus TaxID=582692 RepID=UPI00280B1DD7|nr:DUF3885 domain-containing protein [Paenibacillus polysaccharolyticus]
MSILHFINEHLPNVIFESPFYYNNEYSIRFELGPPDSNIDNNTYYNVVRERIVALFLAIFTENHPMYIVGVSYEALGDLDGYIEGAIDFRQYSAAHTIENLLNKEDMDEETLELTGHDRFYSLECTPSNIDYIDILGLLGGFSQSGSYLSSRIYFIDQQSQLVFHIYDRGLDIVSPTKEVLVYLYKEFNDWILDYDRKEIDKVFKNIS